MEILLATRSYFHSLRCNEAFTYENTWKQSSEWMSKEEEKEAKNRTISFMSTEKRHRACPSSQPNEGPFPRRAFRRTPGHWNMGRSSISGECRDLSPWRAFVTNSSQRKNVPRASREGVSTENDIPPAQTEGRWCVRCTWWRKRCRRQGRRRCPETCSSISGRNRRVRRRDQQTGSHAAREAPTVWALSCCLLLQIRSVLGFPRPSDWSNRLSRSCQPGWSTRSLRRGGSWKIHVKH